MGFFTPTANQVIASRVRPYGALRYPKSDLDQDAGRDARVGKLSSFERSP